MTKGGRPGRDDGTESEAAFSRIGESSGNVLELSVTWEEHGPEMPLECALT